MNIKYLVNLGYDFYPSIEGTETEYVPVPVCQPEVDLEELGTFIINAETQDSLDTPGISSNRIIVGSPNMTVTSE